MEEKALFFMRIKMCQGLPIKFPPFESRNCN